MPRPQSYKKIDKYKKQLTIEKIASYAAKTNETIATLSSYSTEYKEHKKELYSLVADAIASLMSELEIKSEVQNEIR